MQLLPLLLLLLYSRVTEHYCRFAVSSRCYCDYYCCYSCYITVSLSIITVVSLPHTTAAVMTATATATIATAIAVATDT